MHGLGGGGGGLSMVHSGPDHENYAIIGVFWGISGLDKGDLDVYKPDDFEGRALRPCWPGKNRKNYKKRPSPENMKKAPKIWPQNRMFEPFFLLETYFCSRPTKSQVEPALSLEAKMCDSLLIEGSFNTAR